MKRFSLFLLLSVSFSLSAQVRDFSIRLGGNFPLMADVRHQSALQVVPLVPGYASYLTNAGTLVESYEGGPGLAVSGEANISLPKNLLFKVGVSAQYVRFQRRTIVETIETDIIPNMPVLTPVGTPYGSFYGSTVIRDAEGRIIGNMQPLSFTADKAGTTRIMYLQMPLMVGKSFFQDRLTLSGGMVLQATLHASVYTQQYSFINSSFTEGMDRSRDFAPVSVGAGVTGRYMLSKAIGLDLSAQRQFGLMYKAHENRAAARLNLVSIGLSYVFAKKNQLSSINGDEKPFGSGL